MKKIIFIIFALVSLICPNAYSKSSELRVEFQISKMHGLVNFIETISGDPHRSETLKKAFDKSTFNNSKTEELIKEYLEARKPLSSGWTFDGYPEDRHNSQSLDKLFLVRSIFAKNFKDFSERTLGLLPVAEHERLFTSIRKFEPLYDELIWKPNVDKLRNYLDQLEVNAKKWKLDQMFKKALKFYKGNWPSDIPFVVSFYPIPGEHGHSSGESMESVLSIGVLVDEKDIQGRFGVIFHEICHSLYESENKVFQKEFESYFLDSKSKFASYSYQLINEGLATAVGNGWAYEKAAKRVDSGEWYNDKYVNGFAKGLYPEVKNYIETGRTLDRQFVNFAIAKYEKLFPDSVNDYSRILKKIFLMTGDDSIDSNEFRALFKPYFDVTSIYRNSPINHEVSLENLKKSKETVFVVFSEKDKEQIKKLSEAYQPVAKYFQEMLDKKSEFVLSGIDERGRAYIVLKVESKDNFSKALKILKDANTVDRNKPFVEF